MQLDTVVTAYLECALWSSTGEEGEPLDDTYSMDDFAPEATQAARVACADFLAMNRDDLESLDAAQVGHDFWLTRNGHGAGFWDRVLGEVGERLTANTRPYGTVDVYVGDDGKLYIS